MAQTTEPAVGKEGSSDLFGTIENRRSIRRFADQAVSDEALEKVLRAGTRAPFVAQLYSIIYTCKPDKMSKLRVLGIYPTTKVLIMFFVDFRRLEKIIQQRGATYAFDDGYLLWGGLQDVSLLVENVSLAADALGLGSVLIGSPPLHADLISEVYNTPPRVFPVVALCLGYPDPTEGTQVRPRFPLKYTAFEDSYQDLSEADIQECMRVMDEGYLTQGYYIKARAKLPLKEGKDDIDYERYSWSEHARRKFGQGALTKEPLFSIIKRHGFNLE